MPNISTYYDKELKQKCFVVRGDEAYARTTDIDINVTTEELPVTLYNFTCGITINVYRDIGESMVAIYDGDELIDTVEWSDNLSDEYIEVELPYGQHSIRAKYLGNSSCRASQSKSYPIFKDREGEFVSSITISTNSSKAYYDDFTLTHKLVTQSSSTTQRSVLVYVDNELYATKNTTPNSNVSTSFTGLSEGLHTIKYVFAGDEYIMGCTSSVQISYGLNVNVTVPNIVTFNNEDFSYSIAIYDFFGNLINSNFLCELDIPYGISYEGVTQEIQITNGTYTLPTTSIVSNDETTGVYNIGASIGGDTTFIIPVNVVKIDDIIFNSDYYQLQDNETTMLRGSIHSDAPVGTLAGLNVIVDGETVTTDEFGEFSKEYTMESLYDDTVSASCGDFIDAIVIENVLQYWEIGDGVHETDKLYNMTSAKLTKTNTGYQVKSASSSSPTGRIVFRPVYDESVVMTFRVRGQSNSPGNKFMGEFAMSNCPVGNTFKCVKTGSTYKCYVNDVLKKTISGSAYTHLLLSVGQNGSASSLTFSTMKIKRYQA